MTEMPWPKEELEVVPKCPICGSAQRSLLYDGLTDRVFGVAPGAWTLFRCVGCESGYLDPRPTAGSIGRAYEEYYTHIAEDAPEALPKTPLVRRLHAWINDYINGRYGLKRTPSGFGGRWLVPLIPSLCAKANAKLRHLQRPPAGGGLLLDVGFGNGSFLKLASEMGWNAEGIDFDPEAVEAARAQGLNVRCASAEDLSAEKNQYDVITLSHVVEHVHDPIGLLRDLYRLLKPGGWLWLETPNLDSLGARRFKQNWRGLEPPRHLVLFNSTSLRMSLEKIGFQVVRQHWHGAILFSIYLESANMPDSKCGVIQNSVLSLAAAGAELREMVSPDKREFLTLTAKK